MTVLFTSSSPSRFNYNLTVPSDGTAFNNPGAVEIFDAKGAFSGVIAPACPVEQTVGGAQSNGGFATLSVDSPK